MHGEEGASNIDIERLVETFFGDGADRNAKVADTCAGIQDVDMALLGSYRVIETIEIGEFPGIALNAGYVLADSLDGLV